MNRSGPILAEVMTGSYERSRVADKGSYEEVMNGDFLFAPRKITLRRSSSLSRAHICRDNTVKPLRRPARLVQARQAVAKRPKNKTRQLPPLQRRESSSQTQDTLLTTNRQSDLELSTLSMTGAKTCPGDVTVRRDLATCTPSLLASQRPRAVLQRLVFRARKQKAGRTMGSYEGVMNGANPALNDRKL
jgi:hypothetical protein